MFYVILDNQQHSVHFNKEEALVEAAQLDHQYNSTELNDGIKGLHEISVLSFEEMMESPVEMVI